MYNGSLAEAAMILVSLCIGDEERRNSKHSESEIGKPGGTCEI